MATFIVDGNHIAGWTVLRRRGSNKMVPGFLRGYWRALHPSCFLMILAAATLAASTDDVRAASGTHWTDTLKAIFTGSPDDAGTDDTSSNVTRTRFIIGLDKPCEFQVTSLSNPNRVVVELPAVRIQLPPSNKAGPVGLVKSFHGGIAGEGTSRIIINVTKPVIVHRAAVETSDDGKAHRLALEIAAVPGAAPITKPQTVASSKKPPILAERSNLGAGDVQPPLPRPALHPDLRAASAFKPIIVIDPGHGGHDSGAKKNGAVEKEVVLAFSKILRDNLEATGRYKVLMTRATDIFVTLDERRAYAERNKANLFIAVHADYARSKASGATIYSLRESVAKRLKKSAKRSVSKTILSKQEKAKLLKAGSDTGALRSILTDLAKRELDVTRQRTDMFSRSVIKYMGTSTNLRNDPHKTAAFRVLKTAQFPSVLIELAYVTNKEDAARLQSDTWRSKVSKSIVSAVDKYFSAPGARVPM